MLWFVLPEVGWDCQCWPGSFALTKIQTKGLSLEEINEKFGDTVEVHITHITDEERAKLDVVVLAGGGPALDAIIKGEEPEVKIEESSLHNEYFDKLN